MCKVNMVFNTDYWDGLAKIRNYNGVCYGFHTEQQFYDFTEEIPNLNKNMVFLDFGCGPGRIVKTVAPNVAQYTGVDVSEGLLDLARQHNASYSNASFIKCSGSDLKIFDNETFDYVYERLVFIHVPKDWIANYVTEFYRILKPGGILNISDFPRNDVSTNGFTLEEAQVLLKDFDISTIDDSGTTYRIVCQK